MCWPRSKAFARGCPKMPERGNIPKELANLEITDYREMHYNPYRIIYRITG